MESFAGKQLDTRLAIGLGTVEQISRKRVSLSSGEAFVVSGRALDSLKSTRLTIQVADSRDPFAAWLPSIGGLCDALIRPWSRRQAQIVACAILPENLTHEEIARKLDPPVSKQTVSKVLRSARWNALERAVIQFEETVWARVVSES